MRRERKSATAALVIAFISILLPFYFGEEEEVQGAVPEEPGVVRTATAITGGERLEEKDETVEQDLRPAALSGGGHVICPCQARDGKNVIRQAVLFCVPAVFSSAVLLFKGSICFRCGVIVFPAACSLRYLRIRLKKDGKKWLAVLPMQDCRMLCMAQ